MTVFLNGKNLITFVLNKLVVKVNTIFDKLPAVQ